MHLKLGDGIKRHNKLLSEASVGDVKNLGVGDGARVTHTDEVRLVDEGLGAKLREDGRLGGIDLGTLLDEGVS